MESDFEWHLKRGIFKVPVCTSCRKKVWPPSSSCPLCYCKTILKKVSSKGVLVEFSTSYLRDHEGIFGIVDMGEFRMVGSFDSAGLVEGMQVCMISCGIRNGMPYYLFAPEE